MKSTVMTLGTVATYINGRAFKPAEWEACGLPIIRIQNLNDSDAKFNYSSVQHDERFRVQSGDLLFAWSASLGAHIWRGGEAWLNQHIFKVVPNEGIEKMYLYYYLCNVVAELYSKTHGSGMVHITKGPFMATPIPVPSLEEQNRIVACIEELFSELDNGVETLRKTKQKLAVYRQAVLHEAFTGQDSFEPLQSISERIFDGPFGSNLRTADYTNTGIRVVRLENLKDGWFDDSKQSYVTKEKYNTISGHTVYPTDLIMSTFIAGSIKVCQLPKYVEFAINKADCVGIRLKSGFLQKYVMYYLMTKTAYSSLVHEVHGATRPRVNTKQIKGLRIPVCDLSMQNQIVATIEAQLSVCDSIEKSIDAAMQQAEAMRQSILKQAFEGRF